jgi:hypothetical protein
MRRSILYSMLCLSSAAAVSAQFLAGDKVGVATYNNSLYTEGAGSSQRILYEDAMDSTMMTNMIWNEVYVAPCGIWLPMVHENLSEVAYIQEGA